MTSINQERLLYERVGFAHRLRPQWGARFKLRNSAGVLVDGYTIARAVIEPAAYQFIHITTTNPDQYPSDDAHAQAVEDIGIRRFPNTGISYNELVMPGGHPFEGQPMGRRGAHTVNDDQRGICGTAGCPSRGTGLAAPSFNLNVNARACALARNVDDPVTDADVDAIARWCAAGRLAGMVHKDAHIHGHRCVSDKSCPGDRAWDRMDDIADATSDYLRQGDVDMALSSEDIAKVAAASAAATVKAIMEGYTIRPLEGDAKGEDVPVARILQYTHANGVRALDRLPEPPA